MDKKIYIGVDPGKDGFITIFDPQEVKHHFIEMPTEKLETGKTLKSGKPETKTQFSESKLKDIVFDISNKFKGYEKYAAIELVTGRQGWSAQNNFAFGHTAGLQKMILIMLGCDIIEVRPQKWQSSVRQGYQEIKKPSSTGKTMVSDAKAIAEMIVENEFPDIDFRKTKKSKKNHDGKIDSFLICMHLYRTLNK
tara:strand:- start:8673 stop:9254 length:582 start_codon:yes stop_codon:yes gene_type:complete